ncbi:inositol monophosphatase [Pseudonocardiaceae bacterium YIM PH 21723]|nr:inositol monophosphatase [Pseudonocardiaceae bacterium YIM PH 21723]
MPMVNLDLAASTAVLAAEAAGALLRDGLAGPVSARAKDASGDVVTDLDLAAEAVIVDRLRRDFPDQPILTEEAGLLDARDEHWTWLVDPLDGTNNVAVGLHVCAVGIALCRDGIPMVGVVHDPVADVTWSAIRGRGATGPDGLMLPDPASRAGGRILSWVQGYAVRKGDQRALALRLALENDSRRLIQLWAPLLCWVMLARGDIDGFVGYRAGYVDLPAGMLIAQEAGVIVADFTGAPLTARLDQDGIDFVAARPGVLAELLTTLRAGQPVIH